MSDETIPLSYSGWLPEITLGLIVCIALRKIFFGQDENHQSVLSYDCSKPDKLLFFSVYEDYYNLT